MTRLGCLALTATVLVACGARSAPAAQGAQTSRPAVQFPARERVVAALELGEPPDLSQVIRESTHVDAWEVTTTPAAADMVYEPEGPFEPLLDEAMAEAGVTMTRAAGLRCAAQEVARFLATHHTFPTDELTGFLLAACGSGLVDVGSAGTTGTIARRASDAELVAQAGAELRHGMGPALVDGRLVGLGVARIGDDVALVVLSGSPVVRLEPPEPPGADELAIVRGEVLDGDVALVTGTVNQGPMGAAPCRLTPGIPLPAVELRCPMRPEDATALVHIRTVIPGRVLSDHVATLMLRRTPDATPVFAGGPVVEPAATTDGDPAAAAAALTDRLNAVRAGAGLSPVTLALPQSAVQQQAVPYMVGQADRDTLDVLGLGLVAGWEVRGGVIRRGDIFGMVSERSTDVARWLDTALGTPSGRRMLLAPDAEQVAFGVVPVPDRHAVAVVASSYSFYDHADHAAATNGLFQRIVEERGRRSLPPPRRLELPRLDAHAAAVSEGREAPNAAFQAALDEESRRMGRSLRGLVLETIDLDRGELPGALFERRDLGLAVAVGHTRAPGAAWGQWVVFLVVG